MSKARSREDWNRSSGSFSRQCPTSRSSAGGMGRPLSDSGWRLLAEDGVHRLDRGVPFERALSGEHLVQHGSEGEDVRTLVGALATDLFRGHVADRAHQCPGLGPGGQRRVHRSKPRHRPGEAEVEDFDGAVFGEEQVLGFQVSVDDSLLVRGGQPQGDSAGDLGGAAERDRAPVQPLPQRLALREAP